MYLLRGRHRNAEMHCVRNGRPSSKVRSIHLHFALVAGGKGLPLFSYGFAETVHPHILLELENVVLWE